MWSEISDDAITLPAERCKNGRSHVVPLTEMALEIIRSVPQLVGREFLFGERSSVGFRSWTQSKATLKDGCAPWNVHDLRRSVATWLANLGIQPHVIECVLNHAAHRSGNQCVYNKSSYAKEVQRALALWADHVASIVSGEERKVVPLRVS